jgi:hypothetical protein
MDYLAFPLAIDKNTGALARVSARESVAALIEAASRTPPGPWCGCDSFGISDLIEKQLLTQPGVTKPLLMKEMANRLNHVLEKMAGSLCRVQEIRVTQAPGNAHVAFEMNIAWKGGDPGTLALVEERGVRWT